MDIFVYKKVTAEQKAELTRLKKEGCTITEAAARVGLSPGTAYYHWSEKYKRKKKAASLRKNVILDSSPEGRAKRRQYYLTYKQRHPEAMKERGRVYAEKCKAIVAQKRALRGKNRAILIQRAKELGLYEAPQKTKDKDRAYTRLGSR